MEPNIQATRQLHKKVGQLFEETLTNPDTRYQNLTELGKVKNLAHHNARFFLPPNRKENSKKIEIKRVEITTEYQNNQLNFVYQVKWLERKEKTKRKEKKKESMKRRKKKATKTESEESDEPVPLVKKTSSMMKIAGKGRCDGPCGQLIDFSTAFQFGCDHVICENCRKKTPSAALFDGSPGCCHPACVEMAKANGEKLCSGQSESTPSVAAPVDSEMVPTRICILKNYGKDVLRTQLEFEFPQSSRLSMILKSLTHYKDLINNSRFYYSTKKPKRRSDLIPINLPDTNQRFSDIATGKSPILYVIVVGYGIQFYDSR
uniref:RING-type domain-containing protein n=1 Tax=Caenorhabditis tropicalis TaxID=1561998 RepID=A0A1I7T2S8_9PELO